MNGILLVNKEAGYTSRDIVNIVSKKSGINKIGHTGTLDPIATGVLVLCIGEATKIVEVITSYDKEYIAKIILGIKTDTFDITGKVLEETTVDVSDEEILNVISSMLGEYEQQVPIYSAVKVKGKRLYEYARSNEKVELPKRVVDIKKIELISPIKRENGKVIFDIKCTVSKGTYIRSLINDIAQKLSTIGCMASLIRTRQGEYKIEDSYSIKDIENGKFNIIDLRTALKDKFTVKVDKELERCIKNGKILDNIYCQDEILFVSETDDILALYKKYEKDQKKIKPWKMFKWILLKKIFILIA